MSLSAEQISAGVRLCFGYSLHQTPLVWEPLALGLPFFFSRANYHNLFLENALGTFFVKEKLMISFSFLLLNQENLFWFLFPACKTFHVCT
jgi:hypothetical protein